MSYMKLQALDWPCPVCGGQVYAGLDPKMGSWCAGCRTWVDVPAQIVGTIRPATDDEGPEAA